MGAKLTTEKFIEMAREVHGDKYDYSKTVYAHSTKPITFTCPVHGDVEQTARTHLSTGGCKLCVNENRVKPKPKPREVWVSECISKFGGRFDYSKTDYQGESKKVTIICKEHGEFVTYPRTHKDSDYGCNKCANKARGINRRKSPERFSEQCKELFGDIYDYSKTVYVRDNDPVTITCKIHGDFTRTATDVTQGGGCQKCGMERLRGARKTNEEFEVSARLVHGDTYSYENVEYVYAKEHVFITCKTHGDFSVTPDGHLQGHGCPKCTKQYSNSEEELRVFVASLGFEAVRDRTMLGSKKKEVDIFVPEKKIAFEFNGLYWHSEAISKDPVNRHKEKSDKCAEHGVRLIHIYEDQWLHKREIVERFVKNVLGVSENSVYARRCKLVGVSPSEAKEFLDKNHIQGSSRSQVSVGLEYEGGLAAVMQFSNNTSERKANEVGKWELTRYATSCNVVGGASKLFKHFVKEFSPLQVISYSDNDWFSGEVYVKLGFEKVADLPPDYKLIRGNRRFHKANFRRERLEKNFGDRFDPKLTGHENCLKLRIFRIYDSGKKKWLWKPIDNF